MLNFFDNKGITKVITFFEYITPKQTINTFSKIKFWNVHGTASTKKTKLSTDKWILYHDNASSHIALSL